MNKNIITPRFLTCLFAIAFADIIVRVSVGSRDNLNLDINGFYLDDMITYSPASLGDFFNSSLIDNFTILAAEANRPEELQCPSMNVISTRYRCKVGEHWTDCVRSSCCPDYTYVAGRCIPQDVDPCSMNLCEQRCSVYFGRVICTCYAGYRFNQDLHRQSSQRTSESFHLSSPASSFNQSNENASSVGIINSCEDIDECASDNADCEQLCTNTPGSYNCTCNAGYTLRRDNRSCKRNAVHGSTNPSSAAVSNTTQYSAAHRSQEEITAYKVDRQDNCMASCNIVDKLKVEVDDLTERVRVLSTALRLYSFAGAGPPGPEGPAGPEGPPGPRGFPGPILESGTNFNSVSGIIQGTMRPDIGEEDADDDINTNAASYLESVDSYRLVRRNRKQGQRQNGGGRTNREFCRCKRGPVGYPGAAGTEGRRGPKGEPGKPGEKGDPGSFDFLMLMVSDLRHDLEELKKKAYPNGAPSSSQSRLGLTSSNDLKQFRAWEKRMRTSNLARNNIILQRRNSVNSGRNHNAAQRGINAIGNGRFVDKLQDN